VQPEDLALDEAHRQEEATAAHNWEAYKNRPDYWNTQVSRAHVVRPDRQHRPPFPNEGKDPWGSLQESENFFWRPSMPPNVPIRIIQALMMMIGNGGRRQTPVLPEPPSYDPAYEHQRSFRRYIQELEPWAVSASEAGLDSGQQCVSIIKQLRGDALPLALSFTYGDLTQGGDIHGVGIEPVTYLLSRLANAYVPGRQDVFVSLALIGQPTSSDADPEPSEEEERPQADNDGPESNDPESFSVWQERSNTAMFLGISPGHMRTVDAETAAA
jgi:hypothetical protein